MIPQLLGIEAHSGTALNPNTEISPELRAKATRWAGGMSLNSGSEIYEAIHSIPETVWSVYKYTPNGLIIQGLQNSSPQQVETYINSNPQIKQNVKDAITSVWKTITNPIVSTSKLITWLPYMLVAALGIAAVFAFKNPGTVKKFI